MSLICPECKTLNEENVNKCKNCSSDLLLFGKYHLIKNIKDGEIKTYLAYGIDTNVRPDSLKLTVKIKVIPKKEKFFIKEISLKNLQNWDIQDSVKKEADILSQLNHDKIPKFIEIKDISEEKERIYFIREYIEGILLEEEFLNKRYTEDEITEIILEIALILDYLHSLRPPVVFGKIYLSDIIRMRNGKLALIDFSHLGDFGEISENFLKDKSDVKNDYYFLGILALKLLTRKDIEDFIVNGEPDWSGENYISSKFSNLLSGLMTKNPEERISSADEIKNLLKNYSLISDKNTDITPEKDSLFIREFLRIDNVFGRIPKEKNYKDWKSNTDTVLGLGMIFVLVGGWYFQKWYMGLLYAFVYLIFFVLFMDSRYKSRAKNFINNILESIYNGDKELILAVLFAWGKAHELGTEFDEVLNDLVKKEMKTGKINLEKYTEYKKAIENDEGFASYIEEYMKLTYNKTDS